MSEINKSIMKLKDELNQLDEEVANCHDALAVIEDNETVANDESLNKSIDNKIDENLEEIKFELLNIHRICKNL